MRHTRTLYAGLLSLSLAFFLPGCGPGRIEMEKKILASDPSFQKTLDQRNVLQKELDQRRAEYLDKKEKIEKQIILLREKSNKLRMEYFDYFEKIKRQIYPVKRDAEESVRNVQDLLRPKQVEMREIEKEIRDVRALMGKKDKITLTEEEVKAWSSKLASITQKKAAVQKEIDKFKDEIEIVKMKGKVLQIK